MARRDSTGRCGLAPSRSTDPSSRWIEQRAPGMAASAASASACSTTGNSAPSTIISSRYPVAASTSRSLSSSNATRCNSIIVMAWRPNCSRARTSSPDGSWGWSSQAHSTPTTGPSSACSGTPMKNRTGAVDAVPPVPTESVEPSPTDDFAGRTSRTTTVVRWAATTPQSSATGSATTVASGTPSRTAACPVPNRCATRATRSSKTVGGRGSTIPRGPAVVAAPRSGTGGGRLPRCSTFDRLSAAMVPAPPTQGGANVHRPNPDGRAACTPLTVTPRLRRHIPPWDEATVRPWPTEPPANRSPSPRRTGHSAGDQVTTRSR